MKSFLKYTVILILFMLSYSMNIGAVNLGLGTQEKAATAQSTEFSEEENTLCSSLNEWSYSDNSSGSFSDIELNLRVAESYSSSHHRLRRIIQQNDLLKDIMRKFFVLRENSLVLDQSKFYSSDKDPHYSIISSDYYVFALRHILI